MPNGLKPIVDKNSTTLILGTFPGPLSLELNIYYAHPQNLFWPIMSVICNFDLTAAYDSKVRKLKDYRVAIWDVLASCEREGAADAKIRNPVSNDFNSFFAKHTKINKVFFNGRKAESLYFRLVKLRHTDGGIHHSYLPSTSPAYAGIGFERKLEAWRTVVE